ncbi:MAG: NAD(P)/FAD-dependent oxidoreductase [Bdellovibrionota bacterium]
MWKLNNLIIVGSGPSGLTAGIYAGRAKLDPIIITGKTLGGVVAKLKNIENYPGFANPIDGKTLISNMKEQAINSGAKIVNDVIKDFYVLKDKKILIGESGTQYNTKAVIFATGLNQSKSTIKNINDFLGKGVSTCTTCDGPFL